MISTMFLPKSEYGLYAQWLKQQDAETLRMYFGTVVTPGYINELITKISLEPEKHRFLVAFDHDRWLGVVHMADIPGGGAEFGFIVDPAHRNKGIADRLMDEATTWCRNRNYGRLFLHCLSWNEPIKKLCIKHGLKVHNQDGDSEVDVILPPPSIFTVGKEISTCQRNWFSMLLKPPLPV